MANNQRSRVPCVHCGSSDVTELLYRKHVRYFRCETCKRTFNIDRPPQPPRERRSDPKRRRKRK